MGSGELVRDVVFSSCSSQIAPKGNFGWCTIIFAHTGKRVKFLISLGYLLGFGNARRMVGVDP